MNNPLIRSELVKIFQCDEYDWFGDKITSDNKITYHHILKAEHGGRESLANGALLTQSMHRLVHLIEYVDPELYEEITYWFEIINKLRKPLDEELKEIMDSLRERMEKIALKRERSRARARDQMRLKKA